MEFFDKVSCGCVQFYLLSMRCAFLYKTDMHILTIFLEAGKNGYFITGEPDAKESLRGQEQNQMTITVAFINKMERSREQNFMDAFVDYLEEVYYPGAFASLDDETISFELSTFTLTYAK
jgi:hypothetical protein